MNTQELRNKIHELEAELKSFKSQPNWMYMKSREIAEQILAEYKQDLELIFSE